MLLTIGMIVKNEEKYLERCLNGLKPILEQVDSELIIADTGSTDRTVEIAKKFTDNVFYFEWIKDFAAARNSTLEKAQGEWYMFIDADEIFESCDEIIHFFNSGEYEKYKSASYIVRNLLNIDDGERYSDFKAVRLTKLLPETKFINPVHEFLNTAGFPLKLLNDIALHYGYIHKADTEENIAKFKRNAELLLKRYESGERSGTLYSELYDCFLTHEPERANKFLDEGIEFCKEKIIGVLPVLYAKKAAYLIEIKEDYKGALKVCGDYFNMDKRIRPGRIGSDVDLLAVQVMALCKLERFDETISRFRDFLDVYKDYSNGKLNTVESLISDRAVARDDNFLALLQNFTYACIKTKKYALAAEYHKMLPISKYCIVPSVVYISVIQEMELLKNLGYGEASKFYRRFNDEGKRMFREELCGKLFVGGADIEIAEALLTLEPDDNQFNGIIRLYLDFLKGDTITAERIEECVRNCDINAYPAVLYVVIASGIDLSILLNAPEFKAKGAVCYCYSRIKGFHEALGAYSAEYIGSGRSAFAEFMIFAMTAAVKVKRQGVFCERSIDRLFEIYADIGTEETEVAKEIVAARKSGDYKTCIAKMRESLDKYPETALIIDAYRKGVLQEYEAAQPQTEMQRLAAMIKSNIRNYIASGNTDAAVKTLAEYEKINPSDPDIEELKGLLN